MKTEEKTFEKECLEKAGLNEERESNGQTVNNYPGQENSNESGQENSNESGQEISNESGQEISNYPEQEISTEPGQLYYEIEVDDPKELARKEREYRELNEEPKAGFKDRLAMWISGTLVIGIPCLIMVLIILGVTLLIWGGH